jgi:hypothetical protein
MYAGTGSFIVQITKPMLLAKDRLAVIMENIIKPAEKTGGLPVDDKTFVPGWDSLPDTNTIIASLQNTESSVRYTFIMDSFDKGCSTVYFDKDANIALPVSWIFDVQGQDGAHYDISTFAKAGATVSVSITYPGITVIPSVPQPLSPDNTRGWFAPDIPRNTGDISRDETGYKLITGEFNPKTLFGPDGILKHLKTYVVSAQPTISLRFSKFEVEKMRGVFTRNIGMDVTFLGTFKIGGRDNGYAVTKFSGDPSSESVDMEFGPAKSGTGPDLFKETAFILGGVAETY